MIELAAPIGRSKPFLDYLDHLSRIAPLSRPVLVIGERGTGKESAASRLHYLSGVWDGPHVKLNCAALPESLLEDELFGHEAGAFTGAQRRRIGRFELAHNGTLFLDEIANAPMAVQEKILRVIEYGELERVGGTETIKVTVRVIGATNADLPRLAEEGKFRDDLLDRLAFDVVTLPPLRHRQGDIAILADHFGRAMAHEMAWPKFDGFTAGCMAALEQHHWPGNVRELKNVVERAVAHGVPGKPVAQIALDPFSSPWRPVARIGMPRSPEAAPTASPAPEQSTPSSNIHARAPIDFASTVEAFERRLLTEALAANRHNQRATAAHLSLGYHQLRNLLRKYDMLGKDSGGA
jgi:psp operon transcriptional activator